MSGKYSWLFFDLDNTILDFGASSELAFFQIFKNRAISLTDEDYIAYRDINHEMWVEFEKGELSTEEVKHLRWEKFFELKALSLDAQEINAAYFDHIKVNPLWVPGAEEVIHELSKSYNLCIITNGLSEVQESRLALSGLSNLIQHIVISDTIGVAKPSEAFFEFAFKLTGMPMKEEVLVIGDTLTSDIRGGIDYGVDTCWYNYYGADNTTQYHPTYAITKLSELMPILNEVTASCINHKD